MNFNGKVFGAAVAASIAAATPIAASADIIQITEIEPGAKTNATENVTFLAPVKGPLSVYLGSIETGPSTKVSFLSTKLDGTALDVIETGTTNLRQLLDIPVNAGQTVTLAVTSTTQKLGQYSVEFVLGVPEPATWGLMILGFGAVAYSMRRRVAKTGTLVAA